MTNNLPRILMVDDEPHILSGYRRTVGRIFNLTVAEGGLAGLEAIAKASDFAVIVTDMRMPGMNGIEFIAAARVRCRDSVFVMLTGNSDQQTAVDAVNKGHIFRFLSKPCPPEIVEAALTDGLRQYELVTAERVLLRDTMAGSIKLLADALELANPELFQCQSAVKQLMSEVCKAMKIEKDWQLSVAAALCLVGLVTVPRHSGIGNLSEEVLAIVASTGGRLLDHIPRLSSVATMIRCQRDPGILPANLKISSRHDVERIGSQLLRFCVDLARLEKATGNRHAALASMDQTRQYDPRLIAAVPPRQEVQVPVVQAVEAIKSTPISELKPGMVIDEDVLRRDGVLLISKGHTISELTIARLKNYVILDEFAGFVKVRNEPVDNSDIISAI